MTSAKRTSAAAAAAGLGCELPGSRPKGSPKEAEPSREASEPQSAATSTSLKARLRELKECLDEGLLTPEEFQEEQLLAALALKKTV